MSDPNRAPVTQEDRDAAVELSREVEFGSAVERWSMATEQADDHAFVQAFARHRLSALNGERDAIVGWLRANPGVLIGLPSPDDGPFTQQDKTIAAIRQLDADAISRGDHLRGRGSD
jgi:hypothetical protein